MSELRQRVVNSDLQQKACKRFDEMVADSTLKPCRTSRMWLEDIKKDAEWLVIYVGEHIDEKGILRQDGFNVCIVVDVYLMRSNSSRRMK